MGAFKRGAEQKKILAGSGGGSGSGSGIGPWLDYVTYSQGDIVNHDGQLYVLASFTSLNEEPGTVAVSIWDIYLDERFLTLNNPSQAIPATMTATDRSWINDVGHALIANDVIWVVGTLPPELSIATDYYVVTVEANRFEISATLGGAPLEYTALGSFWYYKRVAVACTFDGATNVVQKLAHGLLENDYVKFTGAGLPAEILTTYDYWVVGTPNADDFQVSDSLGGTPIDFGNGNGDYYHMVPIAATINVPTNGKVVAVNTFTTDDILYFTGAGLPPEITPLTQYFVINETASDFEISLIQGGTPVDFSVAGTGDYYYINEAVLSTVIDFYTGVIIVQSVAQVYPQTLSFATTSYREFTVINSPLSTQPISITRGSVTDTIYPTYGVTYFWDGIAWSTIGAESEGLIDKGVINVNTNFPLIADVQIGWWYRIGTNVTDNAGATYTNTGLSFISGEEVYWNGSTWILVGNTKRNVTVSAVALTLSATDRYEIVEYTNTTPITQALPTTGVLSNKVYTFKNNGTSIVFFTLSGAAELFLQPQDSINAYHNGTTWNYY